MPLSTQAENAVFYPLLDEVFFQEDTLYEEWTDFQFPLFSGGARFQGRLVVDPGGTVQLRDPRDTRFEYSANGGAVDFLLPLNWQLKTSGSPVYTMHITGYAKTQGGIE